MKRSFKHTFAFLLVLALLLAQVSLALAAAGSTTRISVDSSDVQGNDTSSYPSTSADGRYVAFMSSASNLVSGDANGVDDIFVRDLLMGTTTRISVDSSGLEGNGGSVNPSISANGRYVAFQSSASNLVSGDTNGWADVFEHDLLMGTTTRVSLDSSGMQGSGGSQSPSISGDGRYVAFASNDNNLVSGDTNYEADIFVRDMLTGTTTRVSLDSSGAQANDGSWMPSISADGRYVAFTSSASNLVSGDTNRMIDVFLRDTQTNTTTRISLDSNGTQGNSTSDGASISADGRHVAFMSFAINLVSGDTNDLYDVFVRDTQTNTTMLVSVSSSGVQENGVPWGIPSISADGRYVAFDSTASNLVSGDTNGARDIFLRDTQANSTTRVSVDSSGAQGNDSSHFTAISADGRFVVFASAASNLVSGDTNGVPDVFVSDPDLIAPTMVAFTATSPSTNLNIPITAFTVSDNVAVTGYLITESSTPPAADATGWSAAAPTSYTVAGDGSYTLYPWAKDAFGNVSAVFASPAYVVVDTTPPAVLSSSRVTASPTAHTSVKFTVTFSEPVTGVDLVGPVYDDFTLTSTGLTGAAITSVSGSGAVYTVTANTGSGDGTLRLDVVTGGGIQDLVGHPLASGFTGGEVYDISKRNISGSVGAAGATISYIDGTLQTTTSAADGSYSLTVPSGWAGTVTPSKAYTIFTPLNRSYAATPVTSNLSGQDFSAAANLHVVDDFNGDGKTEPAVFRKSTGYWYIHYADGTNSNKQWGNNAAGDITQFGDYNGDGLSDYAVWRKSTGTWYIKYADDTTYSQQWGNLAAGDIPVPGDYNGDGKTDIAVWRPSNGTWYVHYMDGSAASQQWGNNAAGDVPVPADYNGDGVTEFAVFRKSTGYWYIRYADGTSQARQWGNAAAGDIPMPGDYNGDGLIELAVWRPTTGFWYVKYADDTSSSQQWGNYGQGDMPVCGDFNGDGKTDYAVWRPSNGTWYVKYADGSTFSQQWGNLGAGDLPLPRR